MNKKMIIIALALVLLVVGAFTLMGMNKPQEVETEAPAVGATEAPAQSETAQTQDAESNEEMEIFELTGQVIEVTDEYVVLRGNDGSEMRVNIGDDTIYEGVEPGEIAVGSYVLVMHDGKMTRSLPPQVYALKVGVYAMGGEVKEVAEGSVTIVRAQEGDEVIVFLPENAPELAAGDQVTVYTNGAMTMSLPAQTTAIGIVK